MENQIIEAGPGAIVTAESIAIDIRATLSMVQEIAENGILHIGQKLVEAKELVPHGEWGKYLQNQVGFSEKSAQNYMRIWREYGDKSKSAIVADLGVSNVLKLLSLSDSAREEIESAVENGEIKSDEAAAEIERLKTEAKQAKEDAVKAKKDAECWEDELSAAENERNKVQTESDAKIAALKVELAGAKKRQVEQIQTEVDKVVRKAKTDLEKQADAAASEQIKLLKAQIEEAEAKAKRAEKEKAFAASSQKIEFAVLARDIQNRFGDMMNLIENADSEENKVALTTAADRIVTAFACALNIKVVSNES